MSIIRVGEIEGSAATNRHIIMESGENIVVSGALTRNRMGAFTFPQGTTAERPSSPQSGMIRTNTETNYVEVYDGTAWLNLFRIPSGSNVGTAASPATSGMQLYEAGLPTGIYWIQPSGQDAYQMYVDNDRNGGGWVLCASVQTSTCQDHMNRSAVRVTAPAGPSLTATSTQKMADAWINAMRGDSSYTGSTAYWLEATGFNKNMFVSSAATANLLDSASNENERTRVTLTYQGSLDDRGPNTGTRGFGDHHTSGGTYFAWGRHPESGNICGFREDNLVASNGFLWVK